MRIILLVDLDAFFASCEQVKNPDLAGKAVIVGADPKGGKGRGIVNTASYSARKFGIYSGQPISSAYFNCLKDGKLQCIFLPPNFELYKKVSERIMRILKKYSDKFEQAGIDEAYLDLTGKVKNFEMAEEIALKIKKEILKKEKLTCSIGIGPNKLIAKIASDFQKPNGLTLVKPWQVKKFLEPLKVRKLIGVGPKTEQILSSHKIFTIGQLSKVPFKKLQEIFGPAQGEKLYWSARGIDETPIITKSETKSIGFEITFKKDTKNPYFILANLNKIAQKIINRVRIENFKFRTIVVKVRFENFETHTRQKTLTQPIFDFHTLKTEAKKLIEPFLEQNRKIRLIGVRIKK